ncbi:hypothetical protein LMG26690_04030 [Achromobacter animicus]|uniref:Uncharacterized protein n=1 Tax=Achromobacter animicus TaxID=1389935 RepID=A0A6S7B8U1_9BURK|nr:hypothetical protein [Achromobacter animicus]CAB3722276.1 hypothetical protein LMG26690_04030 [Achromobacter animicus]
MNTADFSVLPDELVVSLNPLRRGANRARTFCARLTGMAMPWSGTMSGQPARSTRMPARWPFPPAPTPEEVSGAAGSVGAREAVAPAASAPAAGVPAAGASAAGALAGLPVADAATAASAAVARNHSIGDAKAQPVANQLTMKAMITDVVLVLAWGAMIPGLMWLGVAGGF